MARLAILYVFASASTLNLFSFHPEMALSPYENDTVSIQSSQKNTSLTILTATEKSLKDTLQHSQVKSQSLFECYHIATEQALDLFYYFIAGSHQQIVG